MGLKEAPIPTVARMSQCWTTAIVWPRSCPSWRPLAAAPSVPWPGVAQPKVKDKDIFRRAAEKHFGSFSGSAQAFNLPHGLTGRYLQPIKLT